MVTVYFSNETDVDMLGYEPILTKAIEESLLKIAGINAESKTELELSLTFMDNADIRVLNSRFRQIDKHTDVLSFPMFDSWREWPAGGQAVAIGDIVISVEQAEDQSKEYGHSFTRELGFLTVHSMLHLMGYDHMTPDEEDEMCNLQEEILWGVGLSR